ncbi:lysozyme inhibitor LprI family protein [Oceanobacillus sp. Castelsardo]|uniref:lysozyme inhibitor LprI family protein n=1 Tax=Oceanobacillus sp. Castelsardo TaxID=1851204 RepID=UPI000838C74F|nr:lysozyme inhibitor LprI family protein [Oceanobacillus sp. Castelsardo]
MKNNKKVLIAIFTLVLVILLVACESSSEESSNASDNQSQNNLSQNTNDDSSNANTTESVSNIDTSNSDTIVTDHNNTNKTEDTPKNVHTKEEEPSTNYTGGRLKEEYLKKLNNAKKEAEELEAVDSSTYALKKIENDRWDIWDEWLNEIYGVLKEQLPPEEMNQLKEEQRNWIKYRDDRALEASLKYKGGTQEHLEYVTVLAILTEERCYELVEEYMNEKTKETKDTGGD